MPILIALGAGASGTLAGEHAATARTSLPLGGAHVARARSLARTLRGEHASVARRGLTLRGAHRAVGLASPDAWPLALEEGQPPRDVVVSTNLLVGGAPAVVLEFRYDAAPERETLELTVAGDARDQLGRALSVTAAVGEISETYGPLESAGEYSWDATAGTTTLHAARALQAALARTQLPELIEWAGRATSPLGMSQAPRTASVGDVVRGAFAAAGAPLSIPRDTLAGQTWQEGRRDYATAGKTPGALWAESYGLVGHTLVMRAPGYVSLAPGAFIASAAPAAEGTLGAAVTAEARQVPPLPIRLTVRGADKVTPAADLIQIDTSPDPLSLDFELKRQGEWVFGPYVNGAARTWKGYRKAGGQVIAEVEFTTGDVTVRATVDGQPNVRVLRGVATGYTQSMYTYDGGCSDKLLSKITTSTSWGYGLDTVLGSFDTSGPGLYVGAPAGDLLGDERSVTTQTWSPEGYLAARLTQAHQITSLEQTAADTPAPGTADGAGLQRHHHARKLAPGRRGLGLHPERVGRPALAAARRRQRRGGAHGVARRGDRGGQLRDRPGPAAGPLPRPGRAEAGQRAPRGRARPRRPGAARHPRPPLCAGPGPARPARPGRKRPPETQNGARRHRLLAPVRAPRRPVPALRRRAEPERVGQRRALRSGRAGAGVGGGAVRQGSAAGPSRGLVLYRVPGGAMVRPQDGGAPVFVRFAGRTPPNPGDTAEWERDPRTGALIGTGSY